ncbi:MAG: hypothetical protein V2I45_01325 [Halieaceae bacterium]|jgi:hypothetical protein|nr:hypothetical protein [Halieaceae bacterium]
MDIKRRPEYVGHESHPSLTECHRKIVWALSAISDAIPVDLLADSLYEDDLNGSMVTDSVWMAGLKAALKELKQLGLVELREDMRDLRNTSYILNRQQPQITPCWVTITETGAQVAEQLRAA